jgi:hypothetical protein
MRRSDAMSAACPDHVCASVWQRTALWVALLLASVLAGCASAPRDEPLQADAPVDSCRRWYGSLDKMVDRFEARDVQDRRVQGFPQLRQSRFVASFRSQARLGDAAFDAWYAHMRALGDEGTAVEVANVPESGWQGVFPESGALAREKAISKTRACADVLSEFDRSKPERREILLAQPGVPDNYSTLARVLGLYAVTRWPFSAGVNRWQDEAQAAFSAGPEALAGPVQRYVPEHALFMGDPASALALAPRDALGVPRLSAAVKQRLLDWHAPVIALSPQGDFDRFGEMMLSPNGRAAVNLEKPVVYRRMAFTRFGGSTLVQLVYLYWFSERPKTGPFDLLGGALDGVMWRVTLDAHGQPLLYDSAHACGCYHLFFPTPALRPKPSPESVMEWAFMPAPAPSLAPGERVALTLASRTHYLSAVSTAADPSGRLYQSLDAQQLRSLPLGDSAGHRSLYGVDGIVPGSQRGERFFFWPMGVRDAGAQRQWGHHATAFVGRRHFDDADLIERRFEWADALPDPEVGSVNH